MSVGGMKQWSWLNVDDLQSNYFNEIIYEQILADQYYCLSWKIHQLKFLSFIAPTQFLPEK